MYVYKYIHTYLGPFQGCSGVCVFFGVTSIRRFVDSPSPFGNLVGADGDASNLWLVAYGGFLKIGGTPKDP